MPEIPCVTQFPTPPETPSSHCLLSYQTSHQSYISLNPTQSFHFLMSRLPIHLLLRTHSTIAIHLLSAPSSSSNPSFNLPLLIIPFIPYLPPPHHPVFVLRPIPLTSSFLILSSLYLLLQLYPTSDYFPYEQ